MKILLHEDNGFTMLYRKLDKGRFSLEVWEGDSSSIALKAKRLAVTD